MNYVDRKFPSATKSFVDRLFNKLVKKYFGIGFVKLTHFLKKSIACVNITKLYSISLFEMFTICFIIKRLSLSIFTFSHHHATHSSILSITLFHCVPHVLISSKYLRGLAWYHLLDIPMVFLSSCKFFLVCL